MIEEWIKIPYRDFGRDACGADCWGLVRLIRFQLLGSDLPSFSDIHPDDKRGLTEAASAVMILAKFQQIDYPRAGAIAAVWTGGLCVHVGLVVDIEGRRAVIDTARATGVRWARVADFERQHGDVRYYDDRD